MENQYCCYYVFGDSSIMHKGFASHDDAEYSVANSLAGDKNFELPKLRNRWFQVWRKKDYDYIQAIVYKIRCGLT